MNNCMKKIVIEDFIMVQGRANNNEDSIGRLEENPCKLNHF